MGAVYRARAPDGRLVALKVAPCGSRGRPRTRSLIEASCLARLQHPSIVRVLDAGYGSGRTWIAMELIEAPNLEERMRGRIARGDRGLPIREALALFLPLANALSCLRLAEIVHRDVKPSNLVVPRDRPPVLVDFGLARVEDDPMRLTKTGAFVGTLDFAAPEQIELGRSDAASDLYSLGLCLWFAVAGAVPFEGASSYHRALRRLKEDPPRLTEVLPSAPPELAAILERLLRRDPARRIRAPGELAVRLAALGNRLG